MPGNITRKTSNPTAIKSLPNVELTIQFLHILPQLKKCPSFCNTDVGAILNRGSERTQLLFEECLTCVSWCRKLEIEYLAGHLYEY